MRNNGSVAVKRRQTIETSNPGTPAPEMRCPVCDRLLIYQQTFYGVLHPAERWDIFECRHCKKEFEYRHRTRKLRKR